MNDHREMAHRALKRLLANGRLAAVPKRPADQELLVALAASQIDAHRSCLESEVNERLGTWLETISEPFGIDHVTLRRMLVDSLTEYLFNTRKSQNFFCKHCGVRCFGIGNDPPVGKMYGVNIGCLEGVTEEEPSKIPITWVDGMDDRWREKPQFFSHL